jgi:hypothetical protein
MKEDQRTQTYGLGLMAGAIFGLLSAYFYVRAVEEDTRQGGRPESRVQTLDLVGLMLAALAIMRQVAEMGRTPDKLRKK